MFLSHPDESDPDVRRLYDDDLASDGYVMNLTPIWAHQPAVNDALTEFIVRAGEASGLSRREKAIVVASVASTLGDSYCALAWGGRLADTAGPELSASVLHGDDGPLGERERALARWARHVTSDASGTTAADVEELHAAGLTDPQIVALTCYVASRIAFATVNDALGARPDRELVEQAPAAVREAVTFGRPPA